MEECAAGYSFFVVYGHSEHSVDVSQIDVPEVRTESLTREQIEERIKKKLGRKIVVLGACTGSDAHTVGIDAILNYKGYAGDKGLESYKGFESYNLGAQVENEQLVERALALKADVILVSQIITQRNVHKENAGALIDLAKKQGWRDKVVMLLGGPRIDHKLALELGYDAGFGPERNPATSHRSSSTSFAANNLEQLDARHAVSELRQAHGRTTRGRPIDCNALPAVTTGRRQMPRGRRSKRRDRIW